MIQLTQKETDVICSGCFSIAYCENKITDWRITLKDNKDAYIKHCQHKLNVNYFVVPCKDCLLLAMCVNSKNIFDRIDKCSALKDELFFNSPKIRCSVKYRIILNFLSESKRQNENRDY